MELLANLSEIVSRSSAQLVLVVASTRATSSLRASSWRRSGPQPAPQQIGPGPFRVGALARKGTKEGHSGGGDGRENYEGVGHEVRPLGRTRSSDSQAIAQ